jgi:hypothetical protein
VPGRLEGFPGIVAAGAGDAEALVAGPLGDSLDNLIVFIPRQGRAFSGGSRGQHTGNPIAGLEIDQPIEPVIVHRFSGKRCDNGGITT